MPRAAGGASEASGFAAAVEAGARICASGRLPGDASCDLLARRVASGGPDPAGRADLSVYDGPIREVV